jgi:hypothetical protein
MLCRLKALLRQTLFSTGSAVKKPMGAACLQWNSERRKEVEGVLGILLYVSSYVAHSLVSIAFNIIHRLFAGPWLQGYNARTPLAASKFSTSQFHINISSDQALHYFLLWHAFCLSRCALGLRTGSRTRTSPEWYVTRPYTLCWHGNKIIQIKLEHVPMNV